MNSSTDVLALQMQNVSKRYDKFELKNFNLSLPTGEILGLIGPNGAGKSTCLKLLMGFIKQDEGQIHVLGQSILENQEAIKKQVAYVSEEMRLYSQFTIQWHMNFLKSIFKTWDDDYAKILLDGFSLNANQRIQGMSLGQRVKTTLLLALARKPKLLVLDEPSTGLDPIARYELTNELMSLMLDSEHSVIFSSQHTQDVERLSDTIAFLDNGHLISHKDKESYLESWRIIELKGSVRPPLLPGTVSEEITIQGFSVTHSEYNNNILTAYLNAGFEIIAVRYLSLEEIFIQQIRFRRQQDILGRSNP